MKVKVLLFGIARDIAGGAQQDVELDTGANVDALKKKLTGMFPRFNDLKSLMIAVNNEYAHGSTVLSESDEVAIIPPVSGG